VNAQVRHDDAQHATADSAENAAGIPVSAGSLLVGGKHGERVYRVPVMVLGRSNHLDKTGLTLTLTLTLTLDKTGDFYMTFTQCEFGSVFNVKIREMRQFYYFRMTCSVPLPPAAGGESMSIYGNNCLITSILLPMPAAGGESMEMEALRLAHQELQHTLR